MPIYLQKGLFEGDYALSQIFGVGDYSAFGMKGHNGIDYATPLGTPLISCLNGTVTENLYDRNGYGNYIKIENDTCGVIYAHLKKLSDYKPGMQVSPGAIIGEAGNTGNSTGPHLHFGVFPKPRDRGNGYVGYINPLDKELVMWVDSLEKKPVSPRIEELEKELSDMRDSRDSWKKSCSDFEKSLNREKKAMNTLLGQADALHVELTRFNKNVTVFKVLNKEISVLIRPAKKVIKGGVSNG